MFTITKFNMDGGKTLGFSEFSFPAGEVSVKLGVRDYAYKDFPADAQVITARLSNGDDVMKLLLLKDALERFDKTPIELFLPYFPYARQDRVCDKGEAFSLKVFAKLINGLGFSKVTVVDPHSGVTEGVLDRANIVSLLDVVNRFPQFVSAAGTTLLVSPDAGSNKKVSEVAAYLSHNNFIRADKLRDLSTGAIKEMIVYTDDLGGRDVTIVDDICENGGTFIALAAELKKKGAGKIGLYVTHGTFGGDENTERVIDKLLASGIDKIWTTNSYYGRNRQNQLACEARRPEITVHNLDAYYQFYYRKA